MATVRRVTTVVVEEIEPEGWHAREVFANFGLAMYTAQVLEHGIINLAHWTSIHDGTIRTPTDFEDDDAKLSGRRWARSGGP